MQNQDSPTSEKTIQQSSSNNDSCSQIVPHLSTTNNRLNKILITAQEMFKMEGGQEIEAGIGQLKLLIEKINFLKANNKQYDKKIQFICHYNVSCGYQTLVFTKINNSIDYCLRYIEKSIQLLKDLIKQQNKYWFKLTLLLVKIQLQYCALLSQIQNHKKALDIGIEINDILISLFKKGLIQCLGILNENVTVSDEIVSFSRNVLTKAKDYLIELIKIQSYSNIMETNHEEFKKIKENNYFWKDNYENNEKTFRKELQSLNGNDTGSNRNILGLKINNSWIQQFTIGKVMHMKALNYLELAQPDNIVFEFSYRNIIEKIILVSVTYFSIATEMRFIENEKQKAQCNKKQLKKSQIFHLKSIQIVCKNIKQSSVFVNHLINSYQRHYYHDLITIDEEPSFAQYSMVSSKRSRKDKFSVYQQPLDNYCQTSKNKQKQHEILKVQDKKKQKTPLFLFKKKKNSSRFMSGDLDDDKYICIDKSHNINELSSNKTLKKNKVKLQKSTSTSNFHSYRSALKKSFSIKNTNSTTTHQLSKSPQPSIILKGKQSKPSKKHSRRLHH